MKTLVATIRDLHNDEGGAAFIEYTVLLGVILAVSIATIALVGNWANQTWVFLEGQLPTVPAPSTRSRPTVLKALNGEVVCQPMSQVSDAVVPELKGVVRTGRPDEAGEVVINVRRGGPQPRCGIWRMRWRSFTGSTCRAGRLPIPTRARRSMRRSRPRAAASSFDSTSASARPAARWQSGRW